MKIAAPEMAQLVRAELDHRPTSRTLSGAQLVVSALEKEGIDTVWGYPGGAVLPMYDALLSSESNTNVLVRHEQVAVHALGFD